MSKSVIVRYTLAAAILALGTGAIVGCEEKPAAAPAKAPEKAPEKSPEKK